MAIQKIDKYANYRYVLDSPRELEEVKWLVEVGAYKSIEDFIEDNTRAEIRRMKREDREKARKLATKKKIKKAKKV